MPVDVLQAQAQGELKAFVERIERINGDIAEHVDCRKEVFDEAKGRGFDVKTIRKVVALRKIDRVKRLEADALLDLYMTALGEV